MVRKSSLIPGFSKFMDEAVLKQYSPNSPKRILAAGSLTLMLKYGEKLIDSVISSPLFMGMNVVGSDGMIDLEILRDVLKSEINKVGFMRVAFPIIGNVDFTPEDVDTLYNYIIEANTGKLSTPLPQQTTVMNNGGTIY